MPVQPCQGGGKKAGPTGKCYKGKNKNAKAIAQLRAIKASQRARGKI